MPSKQQFDKSAWQWAEKTEPEQVNQCHLNSAYRINETACSKNSCRKNCTGNPNCLTGLGEKEWLSTIDDEYWLDIDDPNEEKRPENSFVGLKNLGATCYVNTFLQVWFHNEDFRRAVYLWIPPEVTEEHKKINCGKEEVVVYQPSTVAGHLQHVFALMQYSSRRYIDPTDFINCLGLDTALQQDAQEFCKLLLSLLEDTLSRDTSPTVQHIIQNQFCGQYAYTTQCNNCLTRSSRPSRFYELDLNIKGHKDLKECLDEFLQEERLEGSNQYFCNTCNSKQNASRRIHLQNLPPVLNLQLLRFVFDRQTAMKKKLNTYIQFPEFLNLSMNLYTNKDVVCEYELKAVLIHRGPSAYSGHYIAHIRDDKSGFWFKYNDEQIDRIEGKKLKLGTEDDLHGAGMSQPKKPRLPKGNYASRNAYMLVYKRKELGQKKGPGIEPDRNVSLEPEIPEHLQDMVLKDNEKFDNWILEMNQIRNASVETGKARQNEIKHIIELFPITDDKYEWFNGDWIKAWLADQGTFNTIPDNSVMMCHHGNLDPKKMNIAKRISTKAADLIYSKYGGGPRLTEQHMCLPCVKRTCSKMCLEARLKEDSKIIYDVTKTKIDHFEGYWIGKESLRTWKKLAMFRNNSESTEEHFSHSVKNGKEISNINQIVGDGKENKADEKEKKQNKFNCELVCAHGNLSTDSSQRRMIPTVAWNLLKKYFPDAPEYDYEQQICLKCKEIKQEDEQVSNRNKIIAAEEKTVLLQLYLDKHRPQWKKQEQREVMLISKLFVEEWRNFVKQPLRYDRPSMIDNTIFLCPHDLLLVKPDIEDGNLEEILCLLWPWEFDILSRSYPVNKMIKLNKSKNEVTKIDSIQSNPEFCIQCIAEKEKQEAEEKKHYNGEKIYLRKVTDVVDKAAFLDKLIPSEEKNSDPDFSQQQPNEFGKRKLCDIAYNGRRSTRHRRVRGEKEVIVSSTNTLKELKVKVMHAFSVAPFDQTLMLDGVCLTTHSNEINLSDLGIYPQCIISVKIDAPCNDTNFLEEVYEASNKPEAGFTGTGLVGNS
ncbi:ubiquitin carboxyl-terminal hydrolase 48-like [Antedon mediterranea]|uniref:ubiquitin carboxyl-terminal hydrolase 48-like n=1 Tax=Antedon mediterranea TaxID=105859 RepID=UPI003AF5889E